MTQPDNFGFTEEAALLKDSARKMLAENFTADVLHGMAAGDPTPERGPALAWDEGLWNQMQELGWGLLAVPEAQGGVGMPLVAVAGLCEELGRAAFPCPLLPTLSASYLLSAAGAGGAAPLEEIAGGATASLAVSNARGSWDFAETPIEVVGGKLEGTACFVQDVAKVSHLLVCARNAAGAGLYWLPVDAEGVEVQGDAIVDLSRDQGRVILSGAEAIEVCADAAPAFDRAMPAIWTLYAADMVGAGEWQLQTTVEYANQRQQFDRPLGFFQAVKHQLVDVMVDIDRAKSLVYGAACAWDTEPEKATRYAHMAKAAASDMAAYASSRSVQCHGGIGFTWECFIHLFFKRQKHSQMLWGDGPWHRARLADIVIG
ncbi:acyl-CoA dehydrogenase [Halioglobus maricola]|uniref:Acyl-CoA dehydrogenase n=1 Tax=Halioglobus maricola TaxID=2601894 RepID=A0A5P9NLU2_9GAMM|nr:acyl-CoA dehydrogenase family protein [Halioglobus maricola]QFU76224.1 acyl-CoA dehydrogenase [Halioglobus maricola]